MPGVALPRSLNTAVPGDPPRAGSGSRPPCPGRRQRSRLLSQVSKDQVGFPGSQAMEAALDSLLDFDPSWLRESAASAEHRRCCTRAMIVCTNVRAFWGADQSRCAGVPRSVSVLAWTRRTDRDVALIGARHRQSLCQPTRLFSSVMTFSLSKTCSLPTNTSSPTETSTTVTRPHACAQQGRRSCLIVRFVVQQSMWMGYGCWPRGLAPKERQHAQRLSCARMCQSSYASCLPNGERPRAGKPLEIQSCDWRRGTQARRRGWLCQAARPDACRCLRRQNAPTGAALPGLARHGGVEHQVRVCTVSAELRGRINRAHCAAGA